jgi:hypothetical protein
VVLNLKRRLELEMEIDRPFPVKFSPDWKKLKSVYYKEYESGDITIKRGNILVSTNHKYLQELLRRKKTITTNDEELRVHKSGRSLILLFLIEHPRYRDKVVLERGKFRRYIVRVLDFNKGDEK